MGVNEVTVLIADDSPKIRISLTRLIKARKMEVLLQESADVEATIAAVDRQQPDILILDLSMPGGGGFDVLSHIRAKGYATRVLVLTSYASEYNRRKSLKLGADCFFDKAREFEMALDFLESECLEQCR
jgi:DNA-binding NarL/FixJ family response regulator